MMVLLCSISLTHAALICSVSRILSLVSFTCISDVRINNQIEKITKEKGKGTRSEEGNVYIRFGPLAPRITDEEERKKGEDT